MKRVIYCPKCSRQHLDSRWWAHQPHETHHCLYKDCRHVFTTDEPCIGTREND